MELKIERASVLSETVRVLRNAILEGHFKPGTRLVESELCAMLSISRPSLREALRRLEAERLVDIIPNRGPVVPIMPWEEAWQIYETRKLLEGEAAMLAARHAKRANLAELNAALAGFRDAVAEGDAAAQISCTKQFYDIILAIGGNRIIGELLEGLNARISFLRAKSMSQPGRGDAAGKEMQAIADAIVAGDETAARNAARSHIVQASHAAKRAYDRMALV